ncbi:hypothetical protein ACIBCH_09935 [Amycolatopsis thailandensis]|uniref:hypothetical protein n=1 Tax=Amycolatopsis thailandensis TaxID=589330 RepID=UPI0037A42B29
MIAWDKLTGQNTIELDGQTFTDLKAVQGGIGAGYMPGDVVVLVKRQTVFFILGRVAAPGGAAGSAPASVNSNHVNQFLTSPVFPAFGDLPSSTPPSVTTYIGSSRAALLLWRCMITACRSAGHVSWDVSGASSIAANSFAGMRIVNYANNSDHQSEITATGFYFVHAGTGLKSGLNTFTMRYSVEVFSPGFTVDFRNSSITVIPL